MSTTVNDPYRRKRTLDGEPNPGELNEAQRRGLANLPPKPIPAFTPIETRKPKLDWKPQAETGDANPEYVAGPQAKPGARQRRR